MQIYSPSHELIYSGYVGDQSYRYKSIMSDNTLTIYISTPEYIDIPIGSYVYFQRDDTTSGEYYYLLRPQNLTKIHTQNWEYVILLESEQYLLRTRQFKFFTENTEETPDKPYKLKGWYTATPFEWLTMLVRNMNDGDTGWTIGSYIESGRKNIEYSGETCLEFIQKLADEFNTEWFVIGKQISLGKVERQADSPIPLSYGYGNGLKPGVKRDIGDTERINRMLVIGGERNIYRSKYGSTTLLLPKNYSIKYDGTYFEDEAGYDDEISIEYITDASGMYVERADKDPNELLKEGIYENTDIYPMREGVVSGVIAVDDEKALYDMVDADNTIDYNDYWADQEKATIAFQTGMLSGKEFEINKYDHSQKRFEIVPITDADVELPKGVFIPAVGDVYGIFNIYVPEQYVQDAEVRLLKDTVKVFHESSLEKFVITCELSTRYSLDNWASIGNKLDVGYFVNFNDPQFFPEPQKIRIVGVKDYINKPKKPILELSNEVRVNGWSSMKADIRDSETVTNKVNQGNMAQTRRMWRDIEQTMQAMYDPDGDFFTENIEPLYIQTMQIVAGTKSLQFEFVDIEDHGVKSDLPVPTYNHVDKSLTILPRGLKHLTIGIDAITPESNRSYLTWNIQTETLILEPDKGYYIYAKCDKSSTDGEYIASTVPIKTEEVDGYYHFWIAYSNTEFDLQRSWRTMYGLTEILPGQITTDKIISADGNSFWDMAANKFKIGDSNTSLQWNIVAGILEMINASFEVKDSNNETIAKIDGSDGSAMFGKGINVFDADGSGQVGKYNNSITPLIQWGNNVAKVGTFDFFNGFLRYLNDRVGIYFGEDIFPPSSAMQGLMRLAYSEPISTVEDTDMVNRLRSVLYLYSEGKQLGLGGVLQNRALHIAKGGIRVEPGNYVDMPGVVMGGRIGGDASIQYRWGVGSITSERFSSLVYRITHNLGHYNYAPLVTPIESGSFKKIHPIIASISSNYFEVVFVDSGTENSYKIPQQYSFMIIGENK